MAILKILSLSEYFRESMKATKLDMILIVRNSRLRPTIRDSATALTDGAAR